MQKEIFVMENYSAHTLPELSYFYDSLEPYIHAETLRIHHQRVHQNHVDALNAVLAQLDSSLQDLPVDELLRNIDTVPEDSRSAVRNHGGGHANHSLLWATLSPGGGGKPAGALGEAIDGTFGSFETFKARIGLVAANLFGSGWLWVVLTRGKLVTYTLPNNDSPLLVGETPLFGLDLWEHTYCQAHGMQLDEYVDAVWNVVDWAEIGRRYEAARDAAAQRRCSTIQCG
jgi:Fe-Mn family superoxide dismutase